MKDQQHSKSIIITLWFAQIILAVCFICGTVMKLFLPIEKLSSMWTWAGEISPLLVKATGVLDLLAGIGIIIPTIFRIYSKIVPLTAIGIIILMFSASIFHICRGEASRIGINIFIAVLASFVFWGKK
jgi:uncharacterized membrane protein YphA (DoxX/SURF4 family)